jgi:hypothetical protein
MLGDYFQLTFTANTDHISIHRDPVTDLLEGFQLVGCEGGMKNMPSV